MKIHHSKNLDRRLFVKSHRRSRDLKTDESCIAPATRTPQATVDHDAQGCIVIDGVAPGSEAIAFKDRVYADVPSWKTTEGAFLMSTKQLTRIAVTNKRFASVSP